MSGQFNLRILQAELDTLREAARRDGKSLGAWLRGLGLARAKRLGIKP